MSTNVLHVAFFVIDGYKIPFGVDLDRDVAIKTAAAVAQFLGITTAYEI